MRAVWGNWAGAPGYTTMYCDDQVSTCLAAFRAFFDGVKLYIPNGVTVAFPNTGDTIDEATGQIDGAWSATAAATVTGTASGSLLWSASSGLAISWRTNNIVRGRRPVGRSYLVPLVSTAFDTNGTLAPTPTGVFNTAISTYLGATGSHLVIWSRPAAGSPGTTSIIVGGTINDAGAVLRSRRD